MQMLASVGHACLRTDVVDSHVDGKYSSPWRRRLSYALVVLLSVLVLMQNYLFIRDRMHFYEMGGKAISQVAEAAEDSRAAKQASVFINLPSWIAPAKSVYALGTEGILLLPAYTPLEDLPQVFTGHPATVAAMRFDTIQTEVPYYVGLREGPSDWKAACNSDCRIFATRYMTDTVEVQPVGEFTSSLDATHALAQFDQAVTLLAADAQRTTNGLQLNLTWRVDQALSPDVTVFVHVLDANGQLSAQADGDPIANTYPFAQWPHGAIVRDIRTIDVVDPASVRVGLYNRATGQRLTAFTSDGRTLPDDAVAITLQESIP